MSFLKSPLSAVALALSLAGPALAHDGVHVDDAYARFLPAAKSGAAFMNIENHSTTEDRLLAVASDVAGKSGLHTHKTGSDGMMQMLPIDGGIVIPAESSHVLERGGDHVMLMALTRRVAEGDTITLTLTFEHAGVVVVEVPVDNDR